MEQTSVSEETGRIAEAALQTAEWSGDDEVTSSEDDVATPVVVDGRRQGDANLGIDSCVDRIDGDKLEAFADPHGFR